MAFQARLLIIFLLVHFNPIRSANILFLLPVPSPSHRLWNNVLIEGLEERGHNLTILTVEHERSRQNVTYICMHNIYEELHEYHKTTTWSLSPKSSLTTIKENYEFGNFVSRKIFASDGLKQLQSYPKSFKFHAIIFDFSMAPALLGFVEHFDFPPLISVSPLSLPRRLSYVSSTVIFPSYISHYSTLYTPVTLRKKISERFMNGIYHTFDWFFARFVYMKNENGRVARVFGDGNKMKLKQLEYSTDLVLINRDFYFDDVLPLPPNVILVAALQAERKNEIPNDDVITFVRSSEKPIILFTMGSNILCQDLGLNIMYEIMNAFRALNDFNFICKCDPKFIKKSLNNVLFVEWMQQNELLANGKVQLIISHGGLLTVQEAIFHEKPLLTIPIDINQHKNSQRSIELGFSESVNIQNFSSTEIVVKVRMLIENPIYHLNIRKASQMLKSRQATAKQTAIYWIEKVLEHNGLSHLKCESRKLSFYKLYMLDITSIISVIMLFYILVIQYHVIKEWIVKRERKREEEAKNEDKVMNERDKLKNE